MADGVWAKGEDCPIENGMSKELAAYIQTTTKLRTAIEAEAWKNQCGIDANEGNGASASIEKAQSAIVGSINETIGFSNFFTSGRFYVGLALKSEIPPGITRDHEALGREMERIRNTVELVYNKCADGVISKTKLLDDPIYDTTKLSLGTIAKDMLKNHVDMMNFYRKTALADDTSGSDFKFVGNSEEFVVKLQNSYGPDALSKCTQSSDSFQGIKEAIDRISDGGGSIWAGIKEWSDAANLMKGGNKSAEYIAIERKVIQKELQNQGVSTKSSEATLKCLDQYNATGNRCSPVGWLTEIATQIGTQLWELVGAVGQAINNVIDIINPSWVTNSSSPSSPISSSDTSDWKNNSLPTTESLAAQAQIIAELEALHKEIREDYTIALNHLWPVNQSEDVTLANLMATHLDLKTTLDALPGYIKLAEQTCNWQAQWKGNCKFGN